MSKRWRLNLLGGASLRCEGAAASGRGSHRRRIALLALLAADRAGHVSRERLITTLWPEAAPERGRALLSESLYALRTGIHAELLLTAGDEIGLNPVVITSDVGEFVEAIGEGAFERAFTLYSGPFLDGFFISESGEFERWSERIRDRFAAEFRSAVGALAEACEARGDWPLAQRHWMRLADDDAYNGTYVYRLMRALAATGDRVGALKAAERHAKVLADDLDVEVAPEIAGLVTELRSLTARLPPMVLVEPPVSAVRLAESLDAPVETSSPSAATDEPIFVAEVDRTPGASTPAATDSSDPAVADATPGPAPGEASAVRPPAWRRHVARLLAGTGLAASALWAWHATPRRAISQPEASDGMISVLLLPFPRHQAPDGGGDTKREAQAVVQLTTLLSVFPRLWIVDGRGGDELSASWRTRSVGELADRARQQGARYVLAPEFDATGLQRLSVQLIDVSAGARIATASAAIAAGGDSAGMAMRSLALDIARIIASQERLTFGEATHVLSSSTSPEALGHYMVARRLMLAVDVDGAVASLARAQERDSSFLLAYARQSVIETWNPRWDFRRAREVVERGLQHAAGQPPIFRRLLEAQRDFVYRRCAESIDRFQRLTADAPDLPDAWSGLGESLYHCRGFASMSGSDAVGAFERAVSADAAMSTLCEHLTELAIVQGDSSRARKYGACVRDPKERDAFALATMLRFGPAERRSALRGVLDTVPRNTVSSLARIFAQNPVLLDTLGQALTHAGRSAADRMWGADYRLLALLAMRDTAGARAAWLASAGSPVFDKWMVAAFLAGQPVDDLAVPMLEWARVHVRESGGPDFSTPYSTTRDAFRALVHQALRSGTRQEVEALDRYINAAAPRGDASDPEIPGMRAVLRARSDLLRSDTASAIIALTQSLQRAPWWVSPWAPLANAAPERRLLSLLHASRGAASDAARWRASFRESGALGDLLYVEERTEPVAKGGAGGRRP